MKPFFLFLMALAALPSFAVSEPQWNLDGHNIYRLYRVDEPSWVETNSEPRYQAELGSLKRVTQADTELDPDERHDRLEEIENGRLILTDPIWHRAYDLLRTALSGKRIRIDGFKMPYVNPRWREHLPTKPNPFSEGNGAGLVHLGMMMGARQEYLSKPPELRPKDLPGLCRFIDEYWTRVLGVEGFAAHAISKIPDSPPSALFKPFWENLHLIRTGLLVAVPTCALTLASVAVYNYGIPWLGIDGTDAAARNKAVPAEVSPQEQADQEARTLAEETIKSFQK